MKNESGFAVHNLSTGEIPDWHYPLVYFVGPEFALGNPVKIGTTGNLTVRLRQMQMGSPLPLIAHGVVMGGEQLERELHHEFRKYRLHGEWFRMTLTLRDRILGFREIYAENMRRARSHIESRPARQASSEALTT